MNSVCGCYRLNLFFFPPKFICGTPNKSVFRDKVFKEKLGLNEIIRVWP